MENYSKTSFFMLTPKQIKSWTDEETVGITASIIWYLKSAEWSIESLQWEIKNLIETAAREWNQDLHLSLLGLEKLILGIKSEVSTVSSITEQNNLTHQITDPGLRNN